MSDSKSDNSNMCESINMLTQLFDSQNRDLTDKRNCIAHYMEYLRLHSFNQSCICSSAAVASEYSLRQTDARLVELYEKDTLNQIEYKEGVRLCRLQEENKLILNDSEISIPLIKIADTQGLLNAFQTKLHLGQVYQKTIEYDDLLGKERKTLGKRNTPDFETIIEQIVVFEGLINELKENRISVDAFKNKDIDELRRIVRSVKKDYDRTQTSIKEMDQEIQRLEPVWKDNCNRLIECALNMKRAIDRCEKNDWSIPDSHSYPTIVEEKYRLYKQMLSLDESIILLKERIDQTSLDKLEEACKQQITNVSCCKTKQWPIPSLRVSDLEGLFAKVRTEKTRVQQSNNTINSAKSIDAYFAKKLNDVDSLSSKDYEMLLSKLEEYKALLLVCGNMNIEITDLKYTDTVKLEETIIQYKKKYEEKKQFRDEISNLDAEICQLNNAWIYDYSLIDQLIDLNDKMIQAISKYKAQGWELPKIKCDDPAISTKKFRHYKKMIETDSDICLLKGKNSSTVKKRLCELCKSQIDNISFCATNRWPVPRLKERYVKDLLGKTERQLKTKRITLIKRVIIGSLVAIICIALIIVAVYESNHAKFPYSFEDVEGEDYSEVLEEIEEAGFEVVKTTEVSVGFYPSDSVINVTVDGERCEKKKYKKDAPIVIYYSSRGRNEITSIVEDWKEDDYKDVKEKLEDEEYIVILNPTKSNTPSNNSHINSIRVNGVEYKSGDCFVPSGCSIEINFYETVKRISKGSSDLVGEDYSDVREMLNDDGFMQIRFVRIDDIDLSFNSLKNAAKHRTVEKVIIDGQEAFEKGDVFNENTEIDIYVHTYINGEYEYIDE